MNAINEDMLRGMCKSDFEAEALFRYFAEQKRGEVETTKESVERILRTSRLDAGKGRWILQQLGRAGCGTYIPGRHTHKSRFKWDVNSIDVAKSILGARTAEDPSETAALPDNVPLSSNLGIVTGAGDSLEGVFNLRPDYSVRLTYPKNISRREARRLADFIVTLPFELDVDL